MNNDVLGLVRSVQNIPAFDAPVGQEYQYASLGHCVLDSIFSIGVRYEGVRTVIQRYCEHYQLDEFYSGVGAPPPASQLPVSGFVAQIRETGPDRFASEIVRNRQRTSPRSGILKAEACLRFAEVLVQHRLETIQDALDHVLDEVLERDLRAVPGQASGISVRYFFMLAGSVDLIKPDRMIIRFLSSSLARAVSPAEATGLLAETAGELRAQGFDVNARSIDFAIWQHQRAIRAPRMVGTGLTLEPLGEGESPGLRQPTTIKDAHLEASPGARQPPNLPLDVDGHDLQTKPS